MVTRHKRPAPLDLVRSDVTKHAKDIVALKARVLEAEQRLAKVETALGTIGKGEMPPNVERQTGTPSEGDGETRSDEG